MVYEQLLLVLHSGPGRLNGVMLLGGTFGDVVAATMGNDENTDSLLVARSDDDVKEAPWRMRATIMNRRCN